MALLILLAGFAIFEVASAFYAYDSRCNGIRYQLRGDWESDLFRRKK